MQVADLFAGLRVKADKGSFAQADKLITRIKQGVAGLIAYKTVNWFKGLVDQTVNSADKLGEMSQQLGVNVEALQQLGYAAELSDSSLEELGGSIKFLSRNAADAAKGGKTQAAAFKSVGVNAKDLVKGSLKLDDALMTIADRFKAMPDGANKTALSMQLFGRSGLKMIPMLNEGREGLAALRKEFTETGAQLDGGTVESMKKFADDQIRLKTVMAGLRNQVVSALMPALMSLLDTLRAWVADNRELLKAGLDVAIKALTIAATALGTAFAVLVDIGKFLWENNSILIAIMLVLGAVMIKVAAAAIAAWLAAAGPIVLIIAAVALLIAIFRRIGPTIIKVFRKALQWVRAAFRAWVHSVKDAFNRVTGFFKGIANGIAQAFSDAWDAVIAGAKRVAQAITDLPVISHLIRAGRWVGGAVSDLTGNTNADGEEERRLIEEGRVAMQNQPAVRSPQASGGSTATTTVDVGGITVNATPGMNEEKVAEVVAFKMEGYMRGADAATGGADE